MPRPFFPSQKQDYRKPDEIRSQVSALAAKVRAHRPGIEAIILFGSYAAGGPGYFSDLDLLVILAEDARQPVERIPEFLLLFQDAPLPVDVFVFTREEVERRSKASDPFMVQALEKGVRSA